MTQLRLGIVGVGAVTQRMLPHLSQDDVQDRVRLQALCDPVAERVEDAARRFEVPRAYTDLDELLADPDVDAVSIATPIGMHFDHCRRALEAGKHVHVHKSMTTTVDDASRLIELARERGRHLVASPGEVLRPQVTRTRELIREGAIGTPAWAIAGAAFSLYHEHEPERAGAAGGSIDPSWYFRKPGGGPLYDMTVYALHQLTSVLGPARRVTALSEVRIPEREFLGRVVSTEADDNSIVLLDFGDGLFAVAYGTAAGSVTQQPFAPTYFGTRGTIHGVLLNGEPFDYPGRDRVGAAPDDDRDAQTAALPHVTGWHRGRLEGHVFEDVMQLVDLVREDRPTPVTAEHARHVIDIMESAYRAAETGRTQDLQTTFPLP